MMVPIPRNLGPGGGLTPIKGATPVLAMLLFASSTTRLTIDVSARATASCQSMSFSNLERGNLPAPKGRQGFPTKKVDASCNAVRHWQSQLTLEEASRLMHTTGIIRAVVAKSFDAEFDAVDLASALMKLPMQSIPPVLGDIPVELDVIYPPMHPSEARPRVEQSVLTWTRKLAIPLADFIVKKPAGSYPDPQRLLKILQNGLSQPERQGQIDQHYRSGPSYLAYQ